MKVVVEPDARLAETPIATGVEPSRVMRVPPSRSRVEPLLTVAEAERTPQEEADRLMAGLRWHDIPVSVRHLRPDGHSAAEILLSAAAEHSALLVMGGYGHSRLREWIFGGFTQRVLRGAEVPVLMAH